MARIKNQFIIKIDKPYSWVQYEDTIEACRCLNGAALKLYLYFNGFAPQEELLFFPSLFCESTKVSMSAEKNAFGELLRENYLKKTSDDYYVFSANKK